MAAQPLGQPAPAAAEASNELQVRLRVYWQSGDDARWSGHARLIGGRLDGVRAWGGEPSSAAVALRRGDAVAIAAGRPLPTGAFFVTAIGPRDSTLRLELAAQGREPVAVELPIAELAARPYQSTLSDAAGVLRVDRIEDDRLAVRTEREQMIFSPGEAFSFAVDAALAGFPPHSPIDLQAELSAGRGGDALESVVERATADEHGSCAADVSLTMPSSEGVYTVKLTARRPSGFMRGWGKNANKPLAERLFQVVVWDESRSERLGSDGPVVVEIDPTNSRWWMRMPEWKWTRKVPWIPKGPLGSSPAELVSGPAGRWVRLGPAAGSAPWQAYPLPIDRPGAAHLLEIEAPANAAQTLDLTLFDRDSIGRAVTLGESLTAVSEPSADGGRVVVRRLFWPRTDSPMLVVSNSGKNDARFGVVRVKALSREAADAPRLQAPRPVMASLADTQATQVLGASLKRSADGRFVYEDWQTFYETAVRLADYVELAGFNGAVVKVASAEGAVYPSSVLSEQCGLDWELVASGAGDLPRKDLVELLLREFERRGLRLTLAMDMASAIPAVEVLRADGDPSVELLDAASRPAGGPRPPYNPLHPGVRQQLVGAIAELAQRCRGRAAFAGLAVRLAPESNAALRSEEWGADARTFDAFLTAQQKSWRPDTERTPDNVRRALAGPLSGPWRSWRTARMTALYGEMAHAVAQAQPGASLHLLVDGLLDDETGRQALRPRLEQRANLDALLRQRGVDRNGLAAPPHLRLASPLFVDLSEDLNQAALPMQQNQLYWDSDSAPDGPAMLLHSKRFASLPGFKARSPFGADRTYTAATLQRVSFGQGAGAALAGVATAAPSSELWEDVGALAFSDEQHQLRRLLAQAPIEASVESAPDGQPLRSAILRTERGAHVVAANPLGWPVEATLTLEASEPVAFRQLSGDPAEQLPVGRLEPGQHLLPVKLPPHGVVVYGFEGAAVKIAGVRTDARGEAVAQLSEKVDQLSRRDLNARLQFDGCPNLSFEQADPEGVPTGWRRVGQAGSGDLRTSAKSVVDGAACVLLTAGQQPVRLVSDPFRPPETRQLVMTFFVRPERRSEDSSLTIRYLMDGADGELFTNVDAKTLAAQGGWRQFVFAEDLPLGGAAPMRIEFEARNLEVSIDKIELQALSFPLDYELGGEARRQRLALVHVLQSAKTALADGRLCDCQQTLDGYWARFLREHTPLVEPEPQVAAEQQQDDEPEEDAPRSARGWKAYLPGFLR